ncbi:MAG: GntR family transcriptional regulator [Desulfotignum sp.]|nr:GntR family transcriptional regulator [Desulfotignum sp.]MCF8086932.1 GntR family transcriptional regulator [Desulfotignum sp.]MCF8137206.1 GntR family transcriptional regulator [Desulfotignum sp.]
MALNKISKPESLAKKVQKALRQSILNNELTPGVIYNEKQIAKDLGISRTPVREALLELSGKRLVKFLPQKGVIINTFSPKEIDDAFEIRMALEGFSVQKICQSKDSADILALEEALCDQEKAVDAKDEVGFMQADRHFHIGFTRLTRNLYLIDMMENIRDIMHLMGFKALGIPGRMQTVVLEHRKILDAVQKKDVSNAMNAMMVHLENSRDAVKQIHSIPHDKD